MILPALTEATSPLFRPIKYSLFPPLGLATLAGYLDPTTSRSRSRTSTSSGCDLDDDPDLVVIQAYITSARRSYEIADHYRRRGVHVAIGGLHPTSLPDEAAAHADTVFLGPGEDTWPQFLDDFARRSRPAPATSRRSARWTGCPPIRRDLIKRHLYLVPNSIVVSRGCPHPCDFCYKDAFFEGGRSFYTQTVDDALAEIERLPGRHLYFLDDHLFGNAPLRPRAVRRMSGHGPALAGGRHGEVGPAAAACSKRRSAAGCAACSSASRRSAPPTSREHHKRQNLDRDYGAAIRRLHDLGVMVNASFVFGMDDDDPTVFDRTVEWAVEQGVETATFHILTPYPGTGLYRRMEARGPAAASRLGPLRHPPRRVPAGPDDARAARGGLLAGVPGLLPLARTSRAARPTKPVWSGRARHLAYAAGWKKFEPVWDALIRARQVAHALPVLESVLSGLGRIHGPPVTQEGVDATRFPDGMGGEPVRFLSRMSGTGTG